MKMQWHSFAICIPNYLLILSTILLNDLYLVDIYCSSNLSQKYISREIFFSVFPLGRNHEAYAHLAFQYINSSTLFRNKMLMLDEMTRRNAYKFVIFYRSILYIRNYENPKLLFPFRAISLMNALIYVDIDQSIH